MEIGVVTLFPEMFEAISANGVTGRAFSKGLVSASFFNPRAFTEDVHRTVDDRPYGGGPGMVMLAGPLIAAIQSAKQELLAKAVKSPKVIYLSPQGTPLTQAKAEQLAQSEGFVLLAGRYEGIDERVIELAVDEEISIGDYVLSGGELPAMVLMDAVIRLLPGALGHKDSAAEDSFVEGLLDCPHYTRPEEFEGLGVPEVLLSGNHAKIKRWRLQQAIGRTFDRRPELIEKRELNKDEQVLMAAYLDQESPE